MLCHPVSPDTSQGWMSRSGVSHSQAGPTNISSAHCLMILFLSFSTSLKPSGEDRQNCQMRRACITKTTWRKTCRASREREQASDFHCFTLLRFGGIISMSGNTQPHPGSPSDGALHTTDAEMGTPAATGVWETQQALKAWQVHWGFGQVEVYPGICTHLWHAFTAEECTGFNGSGSKKSRLPYISKQIKLVSSQRSPRSNQCTCVVQIMPM